MAPMPLQIDPRRRASLGCVRQSGQTRFHGWGRFNVL